MNVGSSVSSLSRVLLHVRMMRPRCGLVVRSPDTVIYGASPASRRLVVFPVVERHARIAVAGQPEPRTEPANAVLARAAYSAPSRTLAALAPQGGGLRL